MEILTNFLYFAIYSFIGWIVESLYCSIRDKKMTNRGFLNGPFIPIYGFGALGAVLIFYGRDYVLIGLFTTSILLAAVLEYITSYLMEKIFNARWWDYSEDPFNINGRICLPALLAFGILSVITVRFLHPGVETVITGFSDSTILFTAGALFAIILIDLSETVAKLFQLNKHLEEASGAINRFMESAGGKFGDIKSGVMDKFEESDFYTAKIKNIFSERQFQIKRLSKAFPDLKHLKYNEILERIKKKVDRDREE